jgi:hypothetical protein
MPKIHVRFLKDRHRTFDQGRIQKEEVGVIEYTGRRTMTARIPLSALGDPDKILISARTYKKTMLLELGPWRRIEINEKEQA